MKNETLDWSSHKLINQTKPNKKKTKHEVTMFCDYSLTTEIAAVRLRFLCLILLFKSDQIYIPASSVDQAPSGTDEGTWGGYVKTNTCSALRTQTLLPSVGFLCLQPGAWGRRPRPLGSIRGDTRSALHGSTPPLRRGHTQHSWTKPPSSGSSQSRPSAPREHTQHSCIGRSRRVRPATRT